MFGILQPVTWLLKLLTNALVNDFLKFQRVSTVEGRNNLAFGKQNTTAIYATSC